MRRGAVLAVVAAAMLLSTVLVSMIATGTEPKDTLGAPDPRPRTSGSSPKTVVLELFTGTWCPPCAYTDPAVSRIIDEYDPSQLLMLAYHLGGSDPYQNAASGARDTFYNIQFVPTVIVDGGGPYDDLNPPADQLWAIGASSNKGTNYNTYRALIDSEFGPGSPLTINLKADLGQNRIDVSAEITATDDPALANLMVRFVVYEDSLYYMGTNNEPYHRAVARAIREQPLTISMGETVTVTDAFTPIPYMGGPSPSRWNRNKLGVAAIVQTNTRTQATIDVSGTPYVHYKGEILQAARVDLVEDSIVVYRDETMATYDYREDVERVLSQEDFTVPHHDFRTYDSLNFGETGANEIRGLPDPAVLARHPMIVWYTAAGGAGALSAAEQSLLQGVLDAGGSHLLLSGENLGADIGATPFYANVLKSTYASDSSGIFNLWGQTGDPISGPWATGGMTITGGSPDIIAPAGNGITTFVYEATSNVAAVRSDYDADSRVVYMGYRYFEGTDANKRPLMMNVIEWFDGMAPPSVRAVYPNGGETLSPGTTYVLEWDARDVEIPADGVYVYYTADSGNPTWNLIASQTPNDGVLWWDPPAGVDSDRCRLRIVARDSLGNEAEDISDADFTIGAPVQVPFSVTLQPGRNLVSFPVLPADTTVLGVLASIDPNFAWVRTYDPMNPSDPWVSWNRGAPSDELSRLENTQGFWVEVTGGSPVTLTINGLRPASTSIMLRAGWNLVGFPSGRTDVSVASVKTATGATAVSGFDGTSVYFLRAMADSEFLLAGNGYWIYVPTDRLWTVTY